MVGLTGEAAVLEKPTMAKSEQIRIPSHLCADARLIAMALHGESLPEYLSRLLREAIARDMPEAAAKVAEKARGHEPRGRKKN